MMLGGMDESRFVGVVEVRITPPYRREDGMYVSEGGEISVRNLADQSDEDLKQYALNALRDNLHPEQDLAGVTERVLVEVEAWPWEKVFPPGTRVRPIGGGEVYTVGFLSSETDLYVEHPVEGGVLGRPWAFVPVE